MNEQPNMKTTETVKTIVTDALPPSWFVVVSTTSIQSAVRVM